MILLARIDHFCSICRSPHRMARINMDFESWMRCRECRKWICSSCMRTDEKAKRMICPNCEDDLYSPLFG